MASAATERTDSEASSDAPFDLSLLSLSTVEQLPLGIVYASRAGQVLWTNQAFCQMVGYSSQELAGASIQAITHSDDLDHNNQEFQRLWAGETTSYTLEKRYARKDGVQTWVRVTATLLRSPEGLPLCAAGYLEDITARKLAEQRVARSRRLIQAVISDVPAALLACDVDGNLTLYNPAAAQLYSIGTDSSSAKR